MADEKQYDRVIRAMTDDGAFRVMTLRSTDTVRDCAAAQAVEGTPANELGEMMTSAILVRETMAPMNRVQVLLQDDDGNTIVGDAFPEGKTRGLVRVKDDALGVRLDQGGAMQVLRSLPGRPPHQGVVKVESARDIDRALHSYFHQSEQVETMLATACVQNDDGIVEAGGFVVQLLPELTAPPLDAMRERIDLFGDLAAQLIRHDGNPRWLMEALLDGTDYTLLAESPICFSCMCGTEKAMGAVATLGEQEILELIEKGETLKVKCDYCRTTYKVGPTEFGRILDEMHGGSAD